MACCMTNRKWVTLHWQLASCLIRHISYHDNSLWVTLYSNSHISSNDSWTAGEWHCIVIFFRQPHSISTQGVSDIALCSSQQFLHITNSMWVTLKWFHCLLPDFNMSTGSESHYSVFLGRSQYITTRLWVKQHFSSYTCLISWPIASEWHCTAFCNQSPIMMNRL